MSYPLIDNIPQEIVDKYGYDKVIIAIKCFMATTYTVSIILEKDFDSHKHNLKNENSCSAMEETRKRLVVDPFIHSVKCLLESFEGDELL